MADDEESSDDYTALANAMEATVPRCSGPASSSGSTLPTNDGTAAADDDINVNQNITSIVGCSANVTFVSAKTGYEFLDDAPIAEVRAYAHALLAAARLVA